MDLIKIFVGVFLIAFLVFGIAHLTGVLDAKVNVTVDQEVKDDVAELTYETVEKAQETTNKAFEALKKALEENNEHGE